MMKEEVHLVVTLSQEMGFSLSLLEPMLLGTPAVVLKRDYVVPLLGEDYPFYVKGVSEAHGMVEHFYRNYPTCYAQFMKYHKEVLTPMYEERFKTDLMYPLLGQAVDDYLERVPKLYAQKYAGKASNSIVQLIAEEVKDQDEFKLTEVIAKLGADGKLDHLAKKLDPGFLKKASLPWLPTWNEQRLVFKHVLGWEDASTEVGHLRRKV